MLAYMSNREFFEEYMAALGGKPKPPELIRRYVTDPGLIEHIEQIEPAFPGYDIVADRIVAEGEWIAMMARFEGTHQGEFAGVRATGRTVSVPFQAFYHVQDRKITAFHIQFDGAVLMAALTA